MRFSRVFCIVLLDPPGSRTQNVHVRVAAQVVRRLVVLAALASLLLPTFAPGHSLIETDRDCGPLSVGTNPAAHRVQSVPPPVQDEHCAFCHWHRAFSGAAPSASVIFLPGTSASASIALRDDRPSTNIVLGLKPSRAPPASVLL